MEQVVWSSLPWVGAFVFILAVLAAFLGRKFSVGLRLKEYFLGFEIGGKGD